MTTLNSIPGLHHVTAIASDPQRNLDFYTEVLGMRFVKRTVNFDDPGTYHFYFGDDAGSPGTILTFFPWPHATRGVAGAGEVSHTAFGVPLASVDYWQQRLAGLGVPAERSTGPFPEVEEEVLTFADPDGMRLQIVGYNDAPAPIAPRFADVPPEHSIRGFYGATLLIRQAEGTIATLTMMGFRKVSEAGNRIRFMAQDTAEGQALGNRIDLLIDPGAPHGRAGAGTVHHIAFRAADDAAQLAWREEIERHLPVTQVLDRDYFHSIYFREPGGVLFEMATDPPGFTADEPIETLGEQLRIPAWLEPQRARIEQRLPKIELHKAVQTETEVLP
jgi:glyoxalase family protein